MKKKITVIGVILIAILLVVGGYLFHAHKAEEKPLEQTSKKTEKKLEKPDEDRVLKHADFEIIDNYNIFPSDNDKKALKEEVSTLLNNFANTLFNIDSSTSDYSNTLTAYYGTSEAFDSSDVNLTANMYKEFMGIHMQSKLKSVEIAHILVRNTPEAKEISVIGAFHIHAKSDRMDDNDYAIPFNSVMSKEQVDGSYKLFTMSYSEMYKEKGFGLARMDDGSYNIGIKGDLVISFDFQNVDDFINQTEAPAGHTFKEEDYDEVN